MLFFSYNKSNNSFVALDKIVFKDYFDIVFFVDNLHEGACPKMINRNNTLISDTSSYDNT